MSADTVTPAATADAPPTTRRSKLVPRSIGRAATTGATTVACVLAVAGGGLLGRALTAPATPVQPAARVGAPVTFASDWQVYRAGERGDVPAQVLPKDWTAYRAGER